MVPWFAWLALPLALWTLRSKRRMLREPAYLMPILATPSSPPGSRFRSPSRRGSSSALLLLPPLAFPRLRRASRTLRRGAANAFRLFGIMTFSFFCILI